MITRERLKELREMDRLSSIFARSIPEPNTGCWLWLGVLNPGGYGSAWFGGRIMGAHKAAFLASGRTIPARYDVDHLCRVRCCTNPDHMEAVTRAENLRRGIKRNGRELITHCPKGHEYSAANTYTFSNSRNCITCQRQRVRDWRTRDAAKRTQQ